MSYMNNRRGRDFTFASERSGSDFGDEGRGGEHRNRDGFEGNGGYERRGGFRARGRGSGPRGYSDGSRSRTDGDGDMIMGDSGEGDRRRGQQ
ncbi:unnamed protein product [Sphagnum tenellum]